MKPAKHNTIATWPIMSEKGFSLIEVIIALAVLTIGVLAVNAMQTVSVRGNKLANDITAATTWSADELERIWRMKFVPGPPGACGGIDTDPLLCTTNNDSIGQDANNNNIDDDDEGVVVDGIGNFGLDQDGTDPLNPPDHVAANDPDADYTIVYNIVDDYPMRNIKTIYAIVTWNNGDKSVTIRHKKSSFM